MKKYILIVICILTYNITYSQNSNRDSILMKYIDTVNVKTSDFNHIFKTVIKPGINNNEKLRLFYYWVYKNFTFDTEGFIKNTSYQNLQETLVSHKGLCYEYNKLLEAACKELKIPEYSIEGYVKFYDFAPGQTFNESNHVWHAVYLDDKWLFIDLLWACGNLHIQNNNYIFKKRLNLEYFLVPPKNFLITHLPADPIWQFENKPLSIVGFTCKTNGIDSSLVGTYINYADSIININKLSIHNRQIRSAIRAYDFNNNNPDILITTYYNVAVELISKKSPTKIDLIHAKLYFTKSKTMMSKTKNQEILHLEPECERGIIVSDRKLKEFKG